MAKRPLKALTRRGRGRISLFSRVERMRAREKYEARRELSIFLAGYCRACLSARRGCIFPARFVRACIQCAATEKRRNNSAADSARGLGEGERKGKGEGDRAFSYLPREINAADLSRPHLSAPLIIAGVATINAARFPVKANKSRVFSPFSLSFSHSLRTRSTLRADHRVGCEYARIDLAHSARTRRSLAIASR